MSVDAIHEDVSGSEVDAQNDAGAATGSEMTLSPRDLMMQQITQQLEEGRSADAVDDDSQAAAGGVPAIVPQVVADDQLAMMKVRVKVDGEELELPLSEVTKGYQKDAVASRRLESAATKTKQLTVWEQDLKNREAALTLVDQSPSNEDIDSRIKAYNAALIEGDEEAATAAFKSIYGNGRQQATQPVIDEDALVVRTETRIDNKKAWDEFLASNAAFVDTDSPERVYGDHLFNREFAPLLDVGEISYREALIRTAEGVAMKFTPPVVGVQVLTTRQQKEIRKQSIDNLPVAVGARVVKQPASANTPVDVIDRMKGWRGQAV